MSIDPFDEQKRQYDNDVANRERQHRARRRTQVSAHAAYRQHHADDEQTDPTDPILASRAARIGKKTSQEQAELDDHRAYARAPEAKAKHRAGREQWYIGNVRHDVEYPV